MKKIQALIAATVCGAILSVSTTTFAQTGQAGFATVVRVAGMASYSLGDDNWHPLVAGKYLPVGAIIRTGQNGVVDVVLGKNVDLPHTVWTPDTIAYAPDSPVRGMIAYKPSAEQNVVRLTPDTTLAIDKLTVTDTGADTVSDTELNLKKGKIFASVKKLTGASLYLIKLPSGIAGVRGTKFSLSADGTAAVFESTGGGLVLSLVLPDGTTKTFVVTPGQLLDPITGQPAVIPGDLANVLSDLFNALQTIYAQVNYASFDSTKCYVSPTHGGHGHNGKGKGQGGGQGGGQE
jgi:hypothetical protein